MALLQMNLCQTYPAGKEPQLQQYLEGIARFLVDRPYSEINIATVRRPFPAPLCLPPPASTALSPLPFLALVLISLVCCGAQAGPVRMRRLQQVMANDGHLAALSRKHREEAEGSPSRG